MKTLELPKLPTFASRQITNAEVFGKRVSENGGKNAVLFVEPNNKEGGDAYRQIINAPRMPTEVTEDPISAAEEVIKKGIIPLFITSAIDPKLKDLMFSARPNGGQLLVDHSYGRDPEHESLLLYPVGTTAHGLDQVFSTMCEENISHLVQERSKRIREIMGEECVPYGDFRQILQEENIREIIIHALGPLGTNIAQVAEEYIRDHTLEEKARTIVHKAGIEPFDYAEWAGEDKAEGVLPLHIECAVFYGMRELYRQRSNEVVFADHHFMLLDEMQLAIPKGFSPHLSASKILIAAHPSPEPLLQSWIDTGIAEWIRASSNSAAAEMVARGEAYACITTESGRVRSNLKKWFSFGSPMMLFTLGTPFSQLELHILRSS